MLTVPVAVATTLCDDAILVENFTPTGTTNGGTEDKIDSDKEALAGDNANSEVMVSSHPAMNIQYS